MRSLWLAASPILERLPPPRRRPFVDALRLRDGPPFKVSGVSATTLLKLAGLDLSANLGGTTVVGQALVARAADGYVTKCSASPRSTRTSATLP